MLSEEIKSVHAALGVLAGKVGQEEWELVRLCRHNLLAVQQAAEEIENRMPVRDLAMNAPDPAYEKEQ